MAQLVYLIIDGGVLLDISIGRRDVGLRLVVIVIRHKILHRVLREELLELRIKLGGESFVMGNDEGRLLQLLNHIGHGEGLAGTSNSQ